VDYTRSKKFVFFSAYLNFEVRCKSLNNWSHLSFDFLYKNSIFWHLTRFFAFFAFLGRINSYIFIKTAFFSFQSTRALTKKIFFLNDNYKPIESPCRVYKKKRFFKVHSISVIRPKNSKQR
jgi:hypothetical protein